MCCADGRQVTLSTLLLNLTIASRSARDAVNIQRCLNTAAQLTQMQTDTEAHFRLLVVIGTALSPAAATDNIDDDDDTDVESRQSLDLDNFLHWCRVDGSDKTRRCSQLLAQLVAE